MLDIVIAGSRPTLRINVSVRPLIEPMNSSNDDNKMKNWVIIQRRAWVIIQMRSCVIIECIHDDTTNVENQRVDVEDPKPECCEKCRDKRNWDHNQTIPFQIELIYV